ncbi:MAG: energy-coupling factor transporter ATPase [Clostridiales bacterium]|nr:energy-coupling factor transporter ATPase [Clostridiales bacterium]
MPIQIEHLTHAYMPDSPFTAIALEDVNLTIEDGEFIGLLGHTGSGKTTLVQHLNGLLKPTSGRIVVDGLDITEKGVSLIEVRKKIGLVFQYPEYQLFEETVAKDVAFGPKNIGLAQEEIDRRVRHALELVGLDYDDVADRSPFELSGGQMRRVAIAGVLAMEPTVLILDEPTAGLDPAGRHSILGMIRELHQSGGITIIMVSHNMDDISTLATRLVVMSRGRMVLTGTPREVFQQADLLTSVGLGVPQAAQLADQLIAEGYDLPRGLYTQEELIEAILSLRGKEAGAC